jgi:hypothetical protein
VRRAPRGAAPSSLRRLTLGALAALATAAACGEVEGINVFQATLDLGKKSEQAAPWKPTDQEPISIELTAPAAVPAGAEVPIRVKVHNGSDRSVGVGFAQHHGFDILVARFGGPADSSAVWSLPKYVSTTRDATVTDPVAPGRDTVFSVVWPGVDDGGRKVPPGTYRIRATVPAELVSRRQLWTEWVPITIGKP